MGNAESNVTSGIKKQAEASSCELYTLMDLKGGGLLIDLMKQASKTKDFTKVDQAIVEKITPFLYNGGKGKLIHQSYFILQRNRDRPRTKLLPMLRGLDDPNDFDIDKFVETYQQGKDVSEFRETCWDVTKRGGVGETILHLCLLSSTSLNSDLAKRLIKFFPKLINDIYMDEQYYGENVLHMAIVNEDPVMTKFLLDHGASYNQRCSGSFMGPEDQKASRNDTLESEVVTVNKVTDYDGYVYWGEYPLSFSACLGQEECYRLIMAKGADPNLQDSNGNMVLHMLVIHDKMQMFDMAYELGALLQIRNNLNLTPLTLAAKLARREMFFHILNIDREVYWKLGNVTCCAYVLSQLDTIDCKTGGIDKDSTLNLVVFGDKEEHLELMDDVVIDLLNAKWNTFIKFRFYRQFVLFCIHFLISFFCFINRPGPVFNKPTFTTSTTSATSATSVTSATSMTFTTSAVSSTSEASTAASAFLTPSTFNTSTTTEQFTTATANLVELLNVTGFSAINTTLASVSSMAYTNYVQHPDLLVYTTSADYIRLALEMSVVFGSLAYLFTACNEARFLGRTMFLENMVTAPSRVLFLFSCILVQAMVVLRFLRLNAWEDTIAVVVMLTTAPYFLFFSRGFKKVGPFVVMIYRMIQGDLLRFVTIYVVFIMGFSQAYYIVFLTFDADKVNGDDKNRTNPMFTPTQSVLIMFLVSLNDFVALYESFTYTMHERVAKILFVVYMAIAAVLLINMLIAMMGNTYQKIAETRNEWQRQWARIVLVVERSVSPEDRLHNQLRYSQLMLDGSRAFARHQQQTDEQMVEMKEMDAMRTCHKRNVLRRAKQREAKQNV